jgi:hypothetical protein
MRSARNRSLRSTSHPLATRLANDTGSPRAHGSFGGAQNASVSWSVARFVVPAAYGRVTLGSSTSGVL